MQSQGRWQEKRKVCFRFVSFYTGTLEVLSFTHRLLTTLRCNMTLTQGHLGRSRSLTGNVQKLCPVCIVLYRDISSSYFTQRLITNFGCVVTLIQVHWLENALLLPVITCIMKMLRRLHLTQRLQVSCHKEN